VKDGDHVPAFARVLWFGVGIFAQVYAEQAHENPHHPGCVLWAASYGSRPTWMGAMCCWLALAPSLPQLLLSSLPLFIPSLFSK